MIFRLGVKDGKQIEAVYLLFVDDSMAFRLLAEETTAELLSGMTPIRL